MMTEEEHHATPPPSPLMERVRASFSLNPDLVSPEKGKISGNFLTRSKPFKRLVDWAYQNCDADQTGHLSKSELYTGFLLMHISLAKYAGPAACYPPSRAVVYKLFDAGDHDHSGGIDRQEFEIIMEVCCAQLTGRIISYWAILILMVPYLSSHVVNYYLIQSGTYTEMAAEQGISLLFFFLAIPLVWNRMDDAMQNVTAAKKPSRGVDAGGGGDAEKHKDD